MDISNASCTPFDCVNATCDMPAMCGGRNVIGGGIGPYMVISPFVPGGGVGMPIGMNMGMTIGPGLGYIGTGICGGTGNGMPAETEGDGAATLSEGLDPAAEPSASSPDDDLPGSDVSGLALPEADKWMARG
jgi:hypothetical protein